MEKFNPITDEIKSLLLDRLSNEYEAHFFYQNAANYCENVGYTLFAKYLKNEAADELIHAGKLQKFLNDWGIMFTIPLVEVSPKFTGLPDILEKAYQIECDLYEAYNDNANTVENIDRSAYNLMLEMVAIQYSSVAEYRTFIDSLSLYGTDKTSIKIFEHETFEN